MPELAIKVSDSPSFRDGDVLEPFNRRRIRATHAQHICSLRNAGFNADGLRPTGSLADRYLLLTSEYLFRRVGDRQVERVDLFQSQTTTLMSVDALDARKQVSDRLRHPRRPLFGRRGAEHWYGGRVSTDHATLDAVWEQIHLHSQLREQNHTRWPATDSELRNHLFITTDDFDDQQAGLLKAAVGDERGIIEKRACQVPWRDLTPLQMLRRHIPDPFITIDVRGLWTWIRDDILRLKGVGNVINIPVLQSELTDDPLGRGYSGMTAADVSTSLNDANRPIVADVPSRTLLEWAAAGALRRIRRAVEPDALNDLTIGGLLATQAQKEAVQSAAEAAYFLLTRSDTSFNATRHKPMVDLLVDASVLTAADRTQLNSMSERLGSRAEELGMDEVYPSYVEYVRNNPPA